MDHGIWINHRPCCWILANNQPPQLRDRWHIRAGNLQAQLPEQSYSLIFRQIRHIRNLNLLSLYSPHPRFEGRQSKGGDTQSSKLARHWVIDTHGSTTCYLVQVVRYLGVPLGQAIQVRVDKLVRILLDVLNLIELLHQLIAKTKVLL